MKNLFLCFMPLLFKIPLRDLTPDVFTDKQDLGQTSANASCT